MLIHAQTRVPVLCWPSMERAVLDWQDLSIAGFADGTYVQLSVADWLRLGGNVERAVAPPELDNRSLEESSSEYTYSYSASGEEVEIEEGAAPSPQAVRVSQPRRRTPTYPAQNTTRTNRFSPII